MDAVTEQFKTMVKDKLLDYARDNLGLSIPANMTKAKIIEAIEKYQAEVVKISQIEAKEAGETVADDTDPMVNMKFVNNESPGTDVEFAYDSGKGLKKGQKCPRYHFFDGEEYNVPYSVVERLNSLRVPDNRWVIDPETKMIRGIKKGWRNRFSCQLTMSREDVMRLQAMKSKSKE